MLRSWSIPPAASFALALTAAIYLRGWILLRLARVPYVPLWRAASFLLGLLFVWVALASPLDTFAGFVLTAHMLQHMIFMMVAPPLILLGNPLVPVVRGLPRFAAREFAGPFLNWRLATRVGNTLVQPIVALLLMGVVMFAWHVPGMYELALHSSAWHEVEHACFFIVALIFWWPVLQPWPSQTRAARWTMVPYLVLADIQNTVLSAILAFSDRVLYPSYAVIPRLFGTALGDQATAGAVMWVIGSIAFVIPAVAIALECLSTNASWSGTVRPSVSRPTFPASAWRLSRNSLIRFFVEPLPKEKELEAASFVAVFIVVGFCFAAFVPSAQDDDNLALRFQSQSGPFLTSVFAQQGSLSAGHVRFDILVQDRNTLDVQRDATIDLTPVANTGRLDSLSAVRADREKSENKLMQTAELNLANEGSWKVHFAVKRDAQFADFVLPLRVVQQHSLPEYLHLWPYIVLLMLGVALLAVYVQRHKNRFAPARRVRSSLSILSRPAQDRLKWQDIFPNHAPTGRKHWKEAKR